MGVLLAGVIKDGKKMEVRLAVCCCVVPAML